MVRSALDVSRDVKAIARDNVPVAKASQQTREHQYIQRTCPEVRRHDEEDIADDSQQDGADEWNVQREPVGHNAVDHGRDQAAYGESCDHNTKQRQRAS